MLNKLTRDARIIVGVLVVGAALAYAYGKYRTTPLPAWMLVAPQPVTDEGLKTLMNLPDETMSEATIRQQQTERIYP